ncbi:chemotaxis protein CheY [Bacillus aquiflavi]|uniref:chemotaxis protein CheY n=1 Tax=Bacillus aquiflavi TaxID=2672567 RepID=UPI001CA89CE4|nr:chemotaxis protein CheY [Bacillus aquiflavi]UAC48154.1 chemotaxis protein CheY [Bacillus aquiflavi]
MTIAVVLNEQNMMTPIVEGTILRIVNEDDFSYEDFSNPALSLEKGRRGATLRFAIEKNATIFFAPPETFCELSYKKALEEEFAFYEMETGQSYATFENLLRKGQIQVSKQLRAVNVVPSAPVKK